METQTAVTDSNAVTEYLNTELAEQVAALQTENSRLKRERDEFQAATNTRLQNIESVLSVLKETATHSHVWSSSFLGPDGIYYNRCLHTTCPVVKYA